VPFEAPRFAEEAPPRHHADLPFVREEPGEHVDVAELGQASLSAELDGSFRGGSGGAGGTGAARTRSPRRGWRRRTI
jgi:hypothetical protein